MEKRLVLIEWVDSHSGRGWQDLNQLEEKAEPLYCQSVGWLIKETEEAKIIVPHISGEKNGNILLQGCGDITIPIKSIIKETRLNFVHFCSVVPTLRLPLYNPNA